MITRLLVLVLVLTASAAIAWWWRSHEGRVTAVAGRPGSGAALADAAGVTGRPALVEFVAPDCVPCRAAKVVLDAAAAERPGIVVAMLDVGDALPHARRHGVLRAPTTFVLDPDGNVVGRVSGVPRRDELAALLDSLPDGAVAA